MHYILMKREGALIGQRALNRGGQLLSFLSKNFKFILAKSLIEKQELQHLSK